MKTARIAPDPRAITKLRGGGRRGGYGGSDDQVCRYCSDCAHHAPVLPPDLRAKKDNGQRGQPQGVSGTAGTAEQRPDSCNRRIATRAVIALAAAVRHARQARIRLSQCNQTHPNHIDRAMHGWRGAATHRGPDGTLADSEVDCASRFRRLAHKKASDDVQHARKVERVESTTQRLRDCCANKTTRQRTRAGGKHVNTFFHSFSFREMFGARSSRRRPNTMQQIQAAQHGRTWLPSRAACTPRAQVW